VRCVEKDSELLLSRPCLHIRCPMSADDERYCVCLFDLSRDAQQRRKDVVLQQRPMIDYATRRRLSGRFVRRVRRRPGIRACREAARAVNVYDVFDSPEFAVQTRIFFRVRKETARQR